MQKSWSGHAVATRLVNPIAGSGDTTFVVNDVTGFPNPGTNNLPFVVIVDSGLTSEEHILCASYAGTTITVFPSVGRGWDGTTAQAHTPGVDGSVIHGLDAATINDHDVFVHSIGTVTPHASAVGDAAADGASGVPADSTHVHAREQWGTDITGNTAGQATSNGSSSTPARSNHRHATPAAYVPPSRCGEIVMYANGPIANSVACDGSTYPNASYPALATYLGQGGTSFTVPDYRGVSPIGAGTPNPTTTPATTAVTARTLGSYYGAETHVISSTELPQHSHGATSTVGEPNGGAGHNHAMGTNLIIAIPGQTTGLDNTNAYLSATQQSSGQNTLNSPSGVSVTTTIANSTAPTTPTPLMQPVLATNFGIMYA